MASGVTRTRGARAIEGVAQPRPAFGSGNDDLWFDRWYPWYSSGLTGHFGYISYNPWLYGSRWHYSRYGGWYDPFWDPFGYGLYGYGPYGYGHHYWGTPYYVVVNDQSNDYDTDRDYGSLRIRANPKTARVYVDGALAGTVDDFDGLSDHLALQQGVHQIEIRAEGYETYSVEVTIEAGKTRTQRASLERVD